MVSKNQIIAWAEKRYTINLIKELRTVSSMGLKEAKDAIDACYTDGTFDTNKVLAVFAPYQNGEYTKTENKGNGVDKITALRQGINCAFANYKKLGYSDPAILIQTVLNNHPQE